MRAILHCALGLALCAFCSAGLAAQDNLPAGDARVMVTVAAMQRGAPPVSPAAFTVRHGSQEWKILGWQRVPPEVQLWIALDDDTNSDMNRRLGDLQNFITHLPSAFQVGLAYFSLSGAQIAAPLSNNHKAVAAAVRPVKASEGTSPDPYASMQALFDQWPSPPADGPGVRRELLVLTDGSIHFGGSNNTKNPSIQKLIARAQQEGIIIFGLSVADAGNPTGVGDASEVQPGLRAQGGGNTMNAPSDTAQMAETEGAGNLQDVVDKTGGWWNVVTLPMTTLPGELAEVLACIQHQFYLVFAVPPGTPPGLAALKIQSKAKGAKLTLPAAVYVAQ